MREAPATQYTSATRWRLRPRLGDAPRWLTARGRALPHFLIVGAQKAGTTSLYDWLAQHPEVVPAAQKELHYFDLQYDRGERWYRSQFPRCAALRSRQTGEATPYYLFHPEAPARAHGLVPRARLIALLREPVSRAYSHYEHERRAGREPASFEAAVERELAEYPEVVRAMRARPEAYSPFHHRLCYLHRGLYAAQLEAWLAHYPREQLLVLQSDALYADPEGALARVLAFLGLGAWRSAELPRRNVGGYRPPELDATLRGRLAEFFREPNERLAKLLGEELPGW